MLKLGLYIVGGMLGTPSMHSHYEATQHAYPTTIEAGNLEIVWVCLTSRAKHESNMAAFKTSLTHL